MVGRWDDLDRAPCSVDVVDPISLELGDFPQPNDSLCLKNLAEKFLGCHCRKDDIF